LEIAAEPGRTRRESRSETFGGNRHSRFQAAVPTRICPVTAVQNSTLIKGDVVEEIRKLKQAPGKGLLQYGVGELTHTMLRDGLVDELRILVFRSRSEEKCSASSSAWVSIP
jgi:hypothetical protein